MTTSLAATVAHTIAFLTNSLATRHPASTLVNLRLVLDANLTALFAPTWHAKDGASHRVLTLSPNCLPPHAIYSACIAANIQWFDWIRLLGGQKFDLCVDPGHVYVRCPPADTVTTVWSDKSAPIPAPQHRHPATPHGGHRHGKAFKTVAQQLLEADLEDDEDLFAMIDHEVSTSGPRALPPTAYSRSSSRSSSSSAFSFGSDALSSATSLSNGSRAVQDNAKQSRRERARLARVFVDTTKTDVTPYDGGKTTVLTGGVMLGGGPRGAKPSSRHHHHSSISSGSSWCSGARV